MRSLWAPQLIYLMWPLLLSLDVHAVAISQPDDGALTLVWSCSTHIELQGQTRHFEIYGQDAWSGEANLRCRHDETGERRDLKMRMSFNSAGTGLGVGDDAKIWFLVRLKTALEPSLLKIFADVQEREGGGLVNWSFDSKFTSGQIRANVIDNPEHLSSLQSGRIFIRPSVPENYTP